MEPERTKTDSINSEVATLVSGSNSDIRQRVIAKLVEDKITQRTNLVLTALAKKADLMKSIRKCKPDQVSIMATAGTPDPITTESYSKTKFEELTKYRRQLAALETAVVEALNDGNYDKLNKEVGKEEAE